MLSMPEGSPRSRQVAVRRGWARTDRKLESLKRGQLDERKWQIEGQRGG